MNQKGNIRPLIEKKRDVLDEFIDKRCADELGLLDLVLIEEMLNQSKYEKQG